MSVLAMAILVPVGATPGAAMAQEEPDPPILFSGTEPGNFWVAYQFSTDENSRIVAETRASDVRLPGQTAYLLYDENNLLLDGTIFTWAEGSAGVYVDANPAPSVNAHVDQRLETPTGGFGATVTLNGESGAKLSGTFKLLMWLATDVRGSSSFSFEAEDGTELLSVRHSPKAFLHTFEDFSGIASADVGFGVGVRANVLTSLDKAIMGTFIGSFFSPSPEAAVTNPDLSMEGPDGSAECLCERYSYAPGDPEGEPARAGDYTFRNTGFDASTGFRELFLGGGDVTLPETLDLGILSLEVGGVPAALPVGQSASVQVTATVANAGPFGPRDALVNVVGTGTGALGVEPPQIQATVPNLDVGQEGTTSVQFLVTCTEAGRVALDLAASVASPGDHDPNPADNKLERLLSIDCI